jgi:peptidoglycan/xylan/chitin deacetylase (PgdA/CDA1 family)
MRTLLLPLWLAGAAAAQPPVYWLLWFDTEDYIEPSSDDAALRLAEGLRERGVRATFKIVGEKARAWVQRGRTDVLRALAAHDIGYHTEFHSIHPAPAEYLAGMGLLDGAAEFTRRERGGFLLLEKLFGLPPSCYG